jgi:hypothetical protein
MVYAYAELKSGRVGYSPSISERRLPPRADRQGALGGAGRPHPPDRMDGSRSRTAAPVVSNTCSLPAW